MKEKLIGFVALILLPSMVWGQIRLENPSFEGEPQDATVPTGWMPCEPGTTPDILPGPWGVTNEPSDGDSFLGLITREDGSFESIGQRLLTPIEEGECYNFKIDLARSGTYTGYDKPLKLRIYGARSRCEKTELLYESPLIKHTEWKEYEVVIIPKFEYNYLIFEAHNIGSSVPRKGNILLDNCSRIKKCTRA